MRVVIIECCGSEHEGVTLQQHLAKTHPNVTLDTASWTKAIVSDAGFDPQPYKGKFDAMVFALRVGDWNDYPSYGLPKDDEAMRKAYCSHSKPTLVLDYDLTESDRLMLVEAWLDKLLEERT
jgi:hypothetical protein